MTSDIELLNYINQNACVRSKSFSSLAKIASGNEMEKFLTKQVEKYEDIKKEIRTYSRMMGKAKDLTKIKPYARITIDSIWSVTKDYVSGELMKNSIAGIKEIEEKLDKYKDADNSILKLTNKLLNIEKENLEILKKL